MSKKKEKVLDELKSIKSCYDTLRNFFTCIDDKIMKINKIQALLKNSNPKTIAEIKFTPEINEQTKSLLNRIGHYINQNFLIRFYAMLESYKYAPQTEEERNKINAINIIRRLRNIFAHTTGEYNPKDTEFDQKGTMKDLVNYCPDLKEKNYEKYDVWPLAIDEVIKPLFYGCHEYINNRNESREEQNKINLKLLYNDIKILKSLSIKFLQNKNLKLKKNEKAVLGEFINTINKQINNIKN